MSRELPLQAASRRLAKAPGRPRTRPVPEPVQVQPGDRALAERASVQPAAPPSMRVRASTLPALGPLTPRLLDLRNAGAYLGISLRSVQNLIASGKLKPVRLLDRRLHLDREDLDALIQATKASQ
jgi:hypothetical protein